MGLWAIGPIVGQYQPESLSESQETEFEFSENEGGVQTAQFKSFGAREIQVSFMVDDLCRPDLRPAAGGAFAQNPSTVEGVWQAIVRMMRPPNGDPPEPVLVDLPGWGTGHDNEPLRAVITSASIERTHIEGRSKTESPAPIQAVRATISVTLKEAAELD